MRIEKTIIFEDDDKQQLNRIEEYCNMAVAFFCDKRMSLESAEEALLPIRRLRQGHSLTLKHIKEAVDVVDIAVTRVRNTPASLMFPESLRTKYLENLMEVRVVLTGWREAIGW